MLKGGSLPIESMSPVHLATVVIVTKSISRRSEGGGTLDGQDVVASCIGLVSSGPELEVEPLSS